MKSFFLTILLSLSGIIYSQVGIGTVTPRAALDISNSTNGGVLVPKYGLSANNDISTVVNPRGTALEVGTLIYNINNVTGANAISEGFVFWNGTVWNRIVPKTELMFRRFTSGFIGGGGTVFNYPQEVFNNIAGASFNGTTLTLPTGIYVIESNIRLNQANSTLDWQLFIDGADIIDVAGSANSADLNSAAGTSLLISVFEITNATADITFQVTNGGNDNVINNQCYLKVEKVN